MMLLVAAAMGVGIGLPHTFVKAYAADLGLHGIKSFFLVYAATAFAVRMGIRGLPQRYGVRPMILAGMASLAASMLLYLVVGSPSSLAAPAVMGGVAHAFLFPAVVAGGSTYFPSRYRGLATTLMLAMFDVGNLIGQPVAGSIIEYSPSWGLPPYATMYVTMAVGFLLVGAIYGWSSRKRRPASAAIPAEPAIELDATAAELRANST
jgi:MFS family permease